jgi:hypothetical protein
VSPTTGRPDRTGFEDNLSQMPVIPSSFKLPGAPTGFPIDLDQLVPEFRDRFALQDLDGNGTIELAESRESLRQALIASGSGATFSLGSTGDSPYNYGEPRQVRFGAEIRF